jgi:NNP family nitrate/nitrite transporter-like MFS transporter
MTPQGTPSRALFSATLGFFIGFAAVALFGTTAARFQEVMHLSPMAVGFLVAMPALSGSLLRIPCAAWSDASGARTPFLVLLLLSCLGMAGVAAVVLFLYPARLTSQLLPLLLVLALLCGSAIATFSVGVSQVSYWFPRRLQGRALAIFAGGGNLAPGLFSLILPFALASFGLAGSYLAWLAMLVLGTAAYAAFARNSPYFQFRAAGLHAVAAREAAAQAGQELFPAASLRESLRTSARTWQTWALVIIYFTTFGGFIALTAWLPTYWHSYYGLGAVTAGLLTGGYSILTSLVRIAGGVIADRLREGGENTAILSLFIMLAGALVMVNAREFELALPGVLLLAVGMGICNAAVFKIVPQAVPTAVGGAAGWVGGLGAFGGFAIPPMMAFAVNDLGTKGYSIGFIVFVFLSLLSLTMAWLLKYMGEIPVSVSPPRSVAEPAMTGRS